MGVANIARQALPICLGVFFGVLDNLPYTLLFLPESLSYLTPIVATMVMNSVIIMQLSFAPTSQFVYGAGACAIEAAPLLAALSGSIAAELTFTGNAQYITSTVLFCFGLTTALVSLSLHLLARFQLGTAVQYLPKEAIIGTVGGVGVYISFAAVGLATGLTWSWQPSVIVSQFTEHRSLRIGVLLALEVAILAAAYWYPKVDFLVPSLLISCCAGFYICLALLGCSLQDARSAGWLFGLADPVGTTPTHTLLQWLSQPFYPYTNLAFSAVSYTTISKHIGKILATTAFIVMQPCLNIPALSLQHKRRFKRPINANDELASHSMANFLSFLCWSMPGYMTFSSSTFLRTCGLSKRWGSFAIGISLLAVVLSGPARVMNLLPRVVAGLFVFHLGGVIAKEAFIDSYYEFDSIEFSTVILMAVTMQYDFVMGVAAGGLVSVSAFMYRVVKDSSPQEPHVTVLASQIPFDSSHICWIQLPNYLFFGNVQLFYDKVAKELSQTDLSQTDLSQTVAVFPKFILMDFTNVKSMDCSAYERWSSIAQLCEEKDVVLVCAGMREPVMKRLNVWREGFVAQSISVNDTEQPTKKEKRPNRSWRFSLRHPFHKAKVRARKLSSNLRKLSYTDLTASLLSIREIGPTNIQLVATTEEAIVWCHDQLGITTNQASSIRHYDQAGITTN